MFKFIGLTLMILAIGVGITYLIAKRQGKDPWDYLGGSGTWLGLLIGAVMITSVITYFYFGPTTTHVIPKVPTLDHAPAGNLNNPEKISVGWYEGFLIKFVGLIVLCIAIGGAVLYLIAKIKKQDPWVYLTGKNAENQWAKIFVLELAIIAIIAGSNWGSALWLPEKHPTPKQRSWVAAELDYLWYGTNVPASTEAPLKILDPSKPLPWRHGTWFWWGAFLILAPCCLVFLCWAYSDDIIKLVEKRREAKRERKMKDEEKDPKKERKESTEDSLIRPPSVWDIFSLVEMFARFFRDWKK